ncbi:MAG: hypothetical protein MUE85_18365 [Microscillaceae bacterium]|jgi:hypothetical protein|nr:hypothetical protein [Microscillaceae bacterium]
MGYSNFKKIRTVVKKFKLGTKWIQLFDTPKPLVEPSNWLLETLELAKLFPLMNEKTKAERVISPILMEVSKHYTDKITFFSGEDLNVKPEDDLSGECDFFFALHPPQSFMDAPIISLAESKDEDMEWGIAQCAAQLYGAKLFNEMEGKNIPVLYGCATDGIEWQFIRFENDIFYLDNKVYTDLKEILGVWHYIIQLYL